jgi:hypothetical protein
MGFFKRFTKPRVHLSLKLEKREINLGEEIKGIVSVTSEEEFELNKLKVILWCREEVKKSRVEYDEVYDMAHDKMEKQKRIVDYWDEATLYSTSAQLCDALHIGFGFKKEFPFSIKIPVSGRETYHSVDRNVEWRIRAVMDVKGRRNIATRTYEVLVAKPSKVVKEVIREVVLIPCSYCGGLMPQTAIFCPNCGARRKA